MLFSTLKKNYFEKCPFKFPVGGATFLEKINYGINYRKTIVDRDSGNLYPIYIYKKKIVVLASEPVGGRSR